MCKRQILNPILIGDSPREGLETVWAVSNRSLEASESKKVLSPHFRIIDGVVFHEENRCAEDLDEGSEGVSNQFCSHEEALGSVQGTYPHVGVGWRFLVFKNVVEWSFLHGFSHVPNLFVKSIHFEDIDGVVLDGFEEAPL